jgi:hypothetical protein
MPRTSARPQALTASAADVVVPQRAMVSSAAFMTSSPSNRSHSRPEGWQGESWHYRDTIGELRYAVSWFSNALSRAVMKVAKYDESGNLVPLDDGPAVDTLEAILGGANSQAAKLKAMGEHYFVAGEWYLVGRRPDPVHDDSDEDFIWEVFSTEEVKKKGERWWIDFGNGRKVEIAEDEDVIRVHVPHPRFRHKADSPVRAVLGVLAEIEMLSLRIKAQARSRLAGSGILLMPTEMTFATPEADNESTDAAQGADPFMVALGRAMAAALADPTSPEALVPILARVPAEHLDKIKHVTFWSEFDAQSKDLLNENIRRLALGIDLPPEVLLGTADVNHWGAWQIEESTIKAHIEPALGVIAATMTAILRKITDDPTVVVIFDTSALRLRPNRSKEATEMYDRGLLSTEAFRREMGFSETDAPDEGEFIVWMLKKVAAGSTTPEQVADALVALGIKGIRSPADEEATQGPPRIPSIRNDPDRGAPEPQDEPDAQRAALMATCDVLVYRAMERAGNRLRNLSQSRPEGVEPADTHIYVQPRPTQVERLLEGAWAPLPRLLEGTGYQPDTVEKCLDAYARSLLTGQQHHARDQMMKFVDAGVPS